MKKSAFKYSKYCLVPQCKSTSIKTPQKIFISLPSATNKFKHKRMIWLRAIGRNKDDISDNTRGFVCEDHFNLEEDMENYIRYKLMGGNIFLKDHVVPHIFSCQLDRKRPLEEKETEQACAVKSARKNIVGTLLDGKDTPNVQVNDVCIEDKEAESTNFTSLKISHPAEVCEAIQLSTRCDKYTQTCHTGRNNNQRSVSVQHRPYYRSKFVQTYQSNVSMSVSVACSPIKTTEVYHNISPSKTSHNSSTPERSKGSNITTPSSSFSSDYKSDSDSFNSIAESIQTDRIKSISVEHSNYLVEHKCRFYLGIPEDSFFVVHLLQKYTSCSLKEIYVTLKKIRTNLPFEHLGDDFGISSGEAAKIFRKCVPHLSVFLKTLILWPSKETIKKLLPIAFRANYHDVESIIDCFEVEIEKPSDPVKQASTWSEYKKSNTMKYLISSTPDGIINFVSGGFGGRTSDVMIVEKSEYLKILKTNCSVMADRGFKRIEILLQPLGCKLIRPPSVRTDTKSSKEEVLETKKIAALRIHIERVIRRIREFKFLKPHSCVNNKIIKYLDHIVIIVCALVNLQSGVIQK